MEHLKVLIEVLSESMNKAPLKPENINKQTCMLRSVLLDKDYSQNVLNINHKFYSLNLLGLKSPY